MSTIRINPQREVLRLTCGQCGETHDTAFDVINRKAIEIEIGRAAEHLGSREEDPRVLCDITHIVTS